MSKVAFVGLGVMGFPMAGHLKQAGHDVTVYNRTAARAEEWVGAYGGQSAPTPRAAAEDCEVVFVCVGNDAHVRSVVLGDDGALTGLPAGSVLVDHSTVSAKIAREIADVADHSGVGFVDAPVSGGEAGAKNGQLAIMCGGALEHFEKAKPVMSAYAKATVRFGEAGAGQLTKMVNQICIAGLVQALSEGLHFAQVAGLDAKQVADLIANGAAGSWQLENRAETMIDDVFDYGFAVDWMRKDLNIALDQARDMGATLPVAALVDQFYGDVQALGGGRWDTSSLIKRLRALHPEGTGTA